jgi:hypothetical protein
MCHLTLRFFIAERNLPAILTGRTLSEKKGGKKVSNSQSSKNSAIHPGMVYRSKDPAGTNEGRGTIGSTW